MSVASMALPGSVPTFGTDGRSVDPMELLKKAFPGVGSAPLKIKKVSVKIFDFSDEKQIKEYEKLWAKLLEKKARLEVAVETSKDLVRRADGTSYWLKYVEYVEFGSESEVKDRKGHNR